MIHFLNYITLSSPGSVDFMPLAGEETLDMQTSLQHTVLMYHFLTNQKATHAKTHIVAMNKASSQS